MKPVRIKLVHEVEPVELRVVARVGEFVAHVPWNAAEGFEKFLTVSHEPTSAEVFCEKARLVRAFMRGAKTGRTLARVAEVWKAFHADMSKPVDPPRAWRAVRRYQRMLQKRFL